VDRFGDNGMISVLIVRRDGATHVIDTWLMSCRVLGRRVEDLVLDALVAQAARDGATRLRGEYLPTARNELVRDHYAGLGFSPEGDDGRWWSLDVVGYTPRRPPIEVD
jgi:FkbH-like protein